MNPLENQTITLPDGRVLGYAEYGHADGYPLLFFHSYPSSRLEGRSIESVACRCGLRILALDRPGFGLSTFQPSRRIVDWPEDVEAFAEQIGLKRFAVLGVSGGGPYALACAYGLRGSMVSAVGVVAGAGPWKAGREGVPTSMYLIHLAGIFVPIPFRVCSGALMGALKWVATSSPVTGVIDRWLESHQKGTKEGQDDEPIRSVAEQRERLLSSLFEGWVQGGGAFVQEGQLLTSQDWGFQFEDVTYDPVLLWHGTNDSRVSIRHARYVAERLPHCVLKEYKDVGHVDIANHLDEILAMLVPEGKFLEQSTNL